MSASIKSLPVWHVACIEHGWATEVYRINDAISAKKAHDAEFHSHERCGDDVPGTVPSWAGEDQVSPCSCVRPAGHDDGHACAHDEPADMVPMAGGGQG